MQHDLIYDLTNHSRDGMTDTYKKIQEKEQYIKWKLELKAFTCNSTIIIFLHCGYGTFTSGYELSFHHCQLLNIHGNFHRD